MRIVRILMAALLLALIGAGAVAWYALHNQARLVGIALAAINERTGLNITPANSRLLFRNHLVVLLEHPRVTMGGREVAHLADIRAVVSYHALLYQNGLPLFALILDRANLQVPKDATNVSVAGLPRLDVQTVTRLKRWLDRVSDIIQRLEVIDSSTADADGKPLVTHLELIATREHRRPGRWPWLLNFVAQWQPAPLGGMLIAGNMRIGAHPDEHDLVSVGRLWFWGLKLNGLSVAEVDLRGQVQGGVRLVLHEDGVLGGSGDLEMRQLTLGGKALTTVMALGDYAFHGSYVASAMRLDFINLGLLHGRSQLFSARASVLRPYEEIRTVIFHGGGVKLALPAFAGWLHSIRGAPANLVQAAERVTSGEFLLSDLSLDTATPLQSWTMATLRDNLRAGFTLTNFGYAPPPESGLPPLQRFDAEVAYAGGKISISQGSGEIGGSLIMNLSAEAGVSRAPSEITYKAEMKGEADFGELYGLTKSAAERVEPRLRGQIQSVQGRAAVAVSAAGTLAGAGWSTPEDYTVRVETSGVRVLAGTSPSALEFKSGAVTARPGTFEFDRVVVSPIGSGNSSVVVSGTAAAHPGYPSLHNMKIELHAVDAAQWLALAVNPEQLAARGLVGGQLVANSQAPAGSMPTVTGKLTLGPGEIQWGFLRAPMVVESATLTFDGKGLALDIPSSRLEGEPLDFRLTVADFAQPAMRIDANAAKLDFEVMRFIRLPWSPKTPPHFFRLPAVGHIDAAAANFDKLAMTNVSTDFFHNDKEWAVRNFTARAFEGRADLNISGRAPDDWIHIKGQLMGMNPAPMFLLTGKTSHSPILGRLFATADLWANTDVDFFDTLAGTAAVNVVDGALDKFTLLTRVLGLLDLKNWITAQFPDPRTVGIPFKTLSADFRGQGGDFYTDNLRVDGPVMDITARGDIRFGEGTMDMDLSLIPFNTANWIVSQIPIIGNNLANGSQGLVAAYFHVRGPVSDPRVTPKPITSVTEFVIKTLSLPINILAPHTIK